MKKLFSLALVMVMLTSVFALVGCNGLWGFDDDDDVVAAPGINWSVKGDVDLADVDGLSLRGATAITTDYSVLEANVYRISDGKKMNDTAAAIGSNGEFTVTFTGVVGSYSVKITHKTLANFYLTRLINEALNNNTTALVVGVVSTGIAEKYTSNPTLDFTAYDTLKTDTEVLAYANALEKEYLTAVTTGEDADGIAATPIVAVTAVALNPTTKSLNKGETFQLTATLTPTTATVASVTYSSSNTAVATVDKDTGLVTAVGGGVANITVTTVSGSKTAVCAVTVNVAVTGISLDKSTLTMEDGSTSTLVATIAPTDATNKTVTWNSSDPAVATVSDAGVVTSLKPGTTTITATAAGNTSQSATCNVTVNAVAVTDVTLNKTEMSLVVNGTERLTASTVPSNATVKTVTWASSNNSVATVSDAGEVKGVAVGTAIITVTTTDGGKTKNCTVTVSAAAVLATGVTLAPASVEVAAGGKTTLTASVLPATATNKNVTWKSSNDTIATVDAGGVVTGVAVGGPVTITVKTADGGFEATCQVTVVAAPTTTTVTFGSAIPSVAASSLMFSFEKAGLTLQNGVVYLSLPGIDGKSNANWSVDTSVNMPGVVVLNSKDTFLVNSTSSVTFQTVLPSGTKVTAFWKDGEVVKTID